MHPRRISIFTFSRNTRAEYLKVTDELEPKQLQKCMKTKQIKKNPNLSTVTVALERLKP